MMSNPVCNDAVAICRRAFPRKQLISITQPPTFPHYVRANLSKAEWAEGKPSTHLLAHSNDMTLAVNYSLDYRLKVGWLIGQTGIEISQSSEPSYPDRAPFVVRNNHFWINVGCG